ncbi:MAG: flagellar assembly protein T N-terminal domain-containing protein [Nitrospirae bacterium]|nr:flagellar assembly protein T N-terminal domain-containing protein [Nitrospirota bacterium]
MNRGISRRLGILMGILALSVWAMVSAAMAGETITADGFAAITGGNTVIARDKAIDDALRKAVEQAVGTMVSSDSMTENYKVIHDKILARTSGYVEKYKIISERPEGDLYRVRVQAEIGRADLTSDLNALGLLHVMVEKPKVMVIIDEKVGGLYGTTATESVGQAESTIIEKLLNAGFNVVDADTVRANITRDKALRILEGDNKAAAAEGLKYGAQVVITGKAFSKNAGGKLYGTNMQSLQATLQARVVRTDTGKVIASKSAQGVQVHIDEMQGGALAIKEASEKLTDELIDLIVKQWSGEVYGRSQEITVMINGLVSYRHLAAVKKILEKETQGVKAVHQRSFTGGVAELALDYGGKSSNIADELAARKFTGFRLEPTNVTPHRIDVKAVLEK